MLRVRGDLEERRRARLEEEVVHDALVLQREPREGLRQREDDVGVPDRQQFAFTLGEPLVHARASGTSGNADCDTS